MKKKMNYGYLVDIWAVVNTNPLVEIFIPKLFAWEESDEKAVINLGDGHEIRCNLKTKLLIKKDDGISEINLPFKKKGKIYTCNLEKILNANKKICPIAAGRRIEIIRYSNCAKDKQSKIEKWFKYMLKKKRSLDFIH